MRITLTQLVDELEIGSTAVLRIDLASGLPSLGAADLVGITDGQWTKVTLGPGLEITSGTLDLAGGGSGYVLPAATAKTLGGVVVGANLSVAGDGTISLAGAGVVAALGLTPVDAAGAAAAAPVQSVGGSTGAVALSYGMTVDFSQGAVPAAGTITLDGRLSGAVTIAAVDHSVGTAGGTIDLAVQIVSSGTATPIGGLSAVSSTSSSVVTASATSANQAAAGDRLELVISKVTGTPAGAHITIRGTRP